MKEVSVNISRWWPLDGKGEQRSVNWVYERAKIDGVKISRHTLTSALKGELDRGVFSTLFKLRWLCEQWSGKKVELEEIFSKKENNA